MLVKTLKTFIQLSCFSDVPDVYLLAEGALAWIVSPEFAEPSARPFETANYGVASDFACGYDGYFPSWTGVPKGGDGTFFVDRKYAAESPLAFFLGIIRWRSFVVLEAFDTWRHPEVSFAEFCDHVKLRNSHIQFVSGKSESSIHDVLWKCYSLCDLGFNGSG